MRKGRKWTKEETNYLIEKCDRVKLRTIAKNLDRTYASVLLKMQRLGLTAAGETDRIVLSEFSESSGISYHRLLYWVKTKNFPARKIGKYYKVNPVDFWKWAYPNRHLINWKSFNKNSILPQPKWLMNQKNVSAYNYWTKEEDMKLKELISYGYTYAELTNKLGRSRGAIKRRIYDLYLPSPRNAYKKEENL